MGMPELSDVVGRLLWTSREAAQALRISERKLWGLTASGEIPFVRIGRSIRYDLKDLIRWIDERKGVRK
jgi:excisionase family DNA binding protein